MTDIPGDSVMENMYHNKHMLLEARLLDFFQNFFFAAEDTRVTSQSGVQWILYGSS